MEDLEIQVANTDTNQVITLIGEDTTVMTGEVEVDHSLEQTETEVPQDQTSEEIEKGVSLEAHNTREEEKKRRILRRLNIQVRKN